MSGASLRYDPERMRALTRRTGEVIEYLDHTTSTDPVAASAIDAIRSISFALSTTWMPLLVRIGADTSMTSWTGLTAWTGLTVWTGSTGRTGSTGWTGAAGWTDHGSIAARWAAVQMAGDPDDPAPPVAEGPEAVARWWSRLTADERGALITSHPELVGNTDGIPAGARDVANRNQMRSDLERLERSEAAGTLDAPDSQALENIRATQVTLEGYADSLDPISGESIGSQLYIYDPTAFGGDGRIAIALGDLDTAADVAVTVSGLGSDASRVGAGQAQNIYRESRWASAGSVAVMSWMGYDAPSFSTSDGGGSDTVDELADVAGTVNQDAARAGAALLATDVAGLNAMRAGNDPHLTVIGNSYGSTAAAVAADEFDLEADDLILTGSPGAGDADTAADLTTGEDHTWVGSASSDVVTYLGETGGWVPQDTLADLLPGIEQLGDDPAEDSFGANRFAAEHIDRDGGGPPGNVHDHALYYAADSESLYNTAAIVAGEYELVTLAEPRDQPGLVGVDLRFGWPPVEVGLNLWPDDPEADRQPVEMTHEPA